MQGGVRRQRAVLGQGAEGGAETGWGGHTHTTHTQHTHTTQIPRAQIQGNCAPTNAHTHTHLSTRTRTHTHAHAGLHLVCNLCVERPWLLRCLGPSGRPCPSPQSPQSSWSPRGRPFSPSPRTSQCISTGGKVTTDPCAWQTYLSTRSKVTADQARFTLEASRSADLQNRRDCVHSKSGSPEVALCETARLVRRHSSLRISYRWVKEETKGSRVRFRVRGVCWIG